MKLKLSCLTTMSINMFGGEVRLLTPRTYTIPIVKHGAGNIML